MASIDKPQKIPVKSKKYSKPKVDLSLKTDKRGVRGSKQKLLIEPILESRIRYSFLLPSTLVGRIRAASYHTPGLTVTDIAENALSEYLARLEKQRGLAFLPMTKKLKAGRPLDK